MQSLTFLQSTDYQKTLLLLCFIILLVLALPLSTKICQVLHTTDKIRTCNLHTLEETDVTTTSLLLWFIKFHLYKKKGLNYIGRVDCNNIAILVQVLKHVKIMPENNQSSFTSLHKKEKVILLQKLLLTKGMVHRYILNFFNLSKVISKTTTN